MGRSAGRSWSSDRGQLCWAAATAWLALGSLGCGAHLPTGDLERALAAGGPIGDHAGGDRASVELSVELGSESSHSSDAQAALAPGRALEFAFVSELGVILQDEVAPTDVEAWTYGRIYEVPGEVQYSVGRTVDLLALPEGLRLHRGRRFDLYGAEGRVCSATVGDLSLVAQYGGYTLEGVLGYDILDSLPVDVDGEPIIPEARVRQAIWESQPHWLMGELRAGPDCPSDLGGAGLLWARDASLPPPTVLRASDEPNVLTEARARAFSSSDAFAALEADYRSYYAGLDADYRRYNSSWEEIARDNPLELISWLDAAGDPRLLELHFGVDDESCGDGHDASADSLELVVSAGLEPTGFGSYPSAVFDINADGHYELLYESGSGWGRELVSLDGETELRALYIEEDWMCPC